MGEFYEWYSEENTCTHLAGAPNACMCLMICGASVFTACTSSDDNPATPDLGVSEKIIGKWVFYERNGELTPTNKKRVFNFVSTTKAYVSASHNSAAEAGGIWLDHTEAAVVIDGNKVTLTMQSDEHTTMVDEFDITDITDSEFTARLKVTAIVDGTEESVSENAIRLTKVTADYSEAILGLWECRGITGGETNNDDNARLEFRKTETHNRQLVVVKQDLAETVRKIGHSFNELNTNAKLQYIVNVDDTPQEIYFDENVLTTILNNLMSNAVKYTPKGEIELALTGDENTAQIVVRDTGYGISKEALPHIFDRYYQVKGAYQPSGTGIGLALVKSLCILHEADIQAESCEGKGTVFTLTLQKKNSYPQALHKESSEDTSAADQQTDDAVPETNDQRPIVLVVEDNTEIRRYIANSLAVDYQVIKASDGKKGCAKAFEHIPDLIITDIMMPVMNGTELCRRLKQDIRTSHIPVIMLTAKDTQVDQQEGYEVGADSYLTKPFSISMLRSRIVNLLTARKRLAAYLSATDKQKTESEADTLSQLDRQFLNDITAYIEQHISDQNITMALIGDSVHMSHSTLYRKIKALTGLSGNEFIRKIRLRHCIHLMIHEHRNISEAAYESGFNNIPYFRNCFKEEYGMTPTEYLRLNH